MAGQTMTPTKFWSSYGRMTIQIPMGMSTVEDAAGNKRVWPKSIKVSFGKPSITNIDDPTLYPQDHGFYATCDQRIVSLLLERIAQAKAVGQNAGFILLEGQIGDILQGVRSNYELVGGVRFDQRRNSLLAEAKRLNVTSPDVDHGLEAYSNVQLEQKIKIAKDAMTKVVPEELPEMPQVASLPEVVEIEDLVGASALEENRIEIKVAKKRGRKPRVPNAKPVMEN